MGGALAIGVRALVSFPRGMLSLLAFSSARERVEGDSAISLPL